MESTFCYSILILTPMFSRSRAGVMANRGSPAIWSQQRLLHHRHRKVSPCPYYVNYKATCNAALVWLNKLILCMYAYRKSYIKEHCDPWTCTYSSICKHKYTMMAFEEAVNLYTNVYIYIYILKEVGVGGRQRGTSVPRSKASLGPVNPECVPFVAWYSFLSLAYRPPGLVC